MNSHSLTLFNLRSVLFLLIAEITGLVGSANATSGSLMVENHIENPKILYQSYLFYLAQKPEGLEGVDSYDELWEVGFYPDRDISSKIVSILDNKEYGLEVRPEESLTPFNLELSIIGRGAHKGDLLYIKCFNNLWLYLRLSPPLNFGNKTISIQQYDKYPAPTNPNAYSVYDVRKQVAFGQDYGFYKRSGIDLPFLNGYYGSEIPYAYFKVEFDRNYADFNNDGKVDISDFAFLASEFGMTGNSLADIAISDPNNAVYLYPDTTPYFDCVVDLADVVKFSENWLLEYRIPGS